MNIKRSLKKSLAGVAAPMAAKANHKNLESHFH